VGFPILGDPQYNTPETVALSEKLGLRHQLLCAKRLELNHPITGKSLVLESGINVDFILPVDMDSLEE
jgi:23S rRNA-/tRNA-specific pseudouridylate synthase